MTEQPKQKKTGGARLPDAKKTPDRKKKKEKIIMIVMIILAVVMVLAATVALVYARWVKKPVLPSAPGISSSPAASGGLSLNLDPDVTPSDMLEEPGYDPVQPKVGGERKSEDFYTILVFGEDESSGLTDTIMVVSYDVTNQKATVMSIPRDTLINSSAKAVTSKLINAVYKRNGGGEKGIEALKNEVSELVGFVPDYYVKVNWALVGQMVDAIGGVWFDVPWDMWYSDPTQDLHIDLKAGYQLLNGDQAMQLVRWRKNMDPVTFKILDEHNIGDVGRLSIQHDFLKAVLKQTLQIQNITKISKLAELFGENVVSDLTIENLFWFGSQAIFGGLSVDDVNFVTMPYLGTAAEEYSAHVYPYQSKLLTLINESLNPFVEDVTIKQLDLIRVNSDGTLSSSTGKLADPSAAIPKPSPEPEPSESDPIESGPLESDPVTTDDPPDVSQDPSASFDPGVSETPEAGPGPDTPDASEAPTIPGWLLTNSGTIGIDGE